MNCNSTHRTSLRQIAALCLGVLGLAGSGVAQTNQPAGPRPSRPAPERVLLIVETSAAMQKRAANVERLVGYMFSSGLNGQLKAGDSIGAWTYNDELQAGQFPLQVWTPQTSREIPNRLARFLQAQRYAKASRLAPVLAQLTNVVANSDRITVIWISDGSEAPAGTGFDQQIAEAFRLNAAEQRRQDMPFVTILRAAQGKFVGLRVNTPPWPLELPSYPRESVPAASNPPPANVEVTPPPPPPPVTTPVVPEPRPRAVETNVVALPATNPPVAQVTPLPPVPETNPAPVTIAADSPPPTNPPAAEPAATNPPTAPASSPPVVAAAAPEVKARIPLIPIVIGCGVALVALVILFVVLAKRPREPRVSLITRSMNKERK